MSARYEAHRTVTVVIAPEHSSHVADGLRVIMGSLIGLIVSATIIFFLDGTTAFWIFGLLLCFFVGPVQSASRSFLGRPRRRRFVGTLLRLASRGSGRGRRRQR